MFKGVGFALIIRQLGLLSKQAINMASDLEEVQNVVDVSFGSMADEVEAFANTAVRSYGMSALTAKRMASTFMAMSNGMDIAQEAGKNMSLQLTALAGDMASFYNVGQDIAQTALNSIFTGETESLKKFGIVLTETNLEAFALSQGIKKSYQAMSQAEKVALRYNYVLNATKNAQGDFARTSGSWANQIRLLKEQWTQFLGILGSGLIKILTPMVKALNQMLASLISIGNAITKVFGGKTTNNMSTTIKDSAGSAGDLDAGLGDANNTAKKLSRTIAGFDELNVLNPKEEEKKPDSGNTGSDVGAGNIADFKIDETQTEGVKTRLEQFVKDCQEILNKWQSTIPKLEINFDTEKALSNLQNIGKNLLDIIAGWGSFVITIGIDIANDLDIGRLGNDVLELINAFTTLGSSVTGAVVPALETFYRVGLSPLTKAVGDVAHEMLQWITGQLRGWADWFNTNKEQINIFAENLGKVVAPLSSIVGELLKVAWDVLATVLNLINEALKKILDEIIKMDEGELKAIVATLITLAGIKVTTDVVKMFSSMSRDADGFLGKLSYLEGYLTGDGKITGFFTKFGESWNKANDATREGISNVVGHFRALPSKLVETGTGVKTFITTTLPAWFKGLPETFGAITTQVTGSVSSAFSSVVTYFSENGILGGAFKGLQAMVGGIGKAFQGLWGIISANPLAIILVAIVALAVAFHQLWTTNEEFRNQIKTIWTDTIKPVVSELGAKIKELWVDHLKPFFEQLKESGGELMVTLKKFWDETLKPLLGNVIRVLGVVISTAIGILGGLLKGVITIIGGVTDIFSGIIEFLEGIFTGDWEKVWNGIEKIFSGICDTIKGIFEGVINGIVDGVNNAIKAIKNLFGTADKEEKNAKLPKNTRNKAKDIDIPQMTHFAKGGVLHSPTVGLMGEYAGASNNPEIVTPQSLMRETMEDANASLINAIFAIGNQISKSVDDKNMDVYMDTAKVTRRITKEQTAQKKQMGTSLVMV